MKKKMSKLLLKDLLELEKVPTMSYSKTKQIGSLYVNIKN